MVATNAVAERTTRAVSSSRPMIVKETLEMETEQRKLLGEFVKKNMIEGTDYGVIPGTERKDKDGKPLPTTPALLKPGAEKLTSLFRCAARFELTDVIRDFDRPLFYFEYRCELVSLDTGGIVAEGVGSANSHESKYRYRNSDRTCPECGKAAIKRSKFPPREDPDAQPGWYCFAKAGGCGANFDADDGGIIAQVAGKVENPDVADQANSIQKIAKKRSQVDAAITLARCSDMFTQDVDDMAENAAASEPAAKPQSKKTTKAPPPDDSGYHGNDAFPDENGGASPAMLRKELEHNIGEMMKAKGIDRAKVIEGLVKSIKSSGGNPPADMAQWHPSTLKLACDRLTKWLADIQAGTATAPLPKPDAHPVIEAEPEPVPEATPPIEKGKLPKPVVDQFLAAFHECGTNWDVIRTQGLGLIGRRLTADCHFSALTLDEANKCLEWARAEKGRKDKAKKILEGQAA